MNTSGSSSATASRMDTVPRRINLTINEVVIMGEASFGFVFRFRLFVAMAPSQVKARVPSVVAFVSFRPVR